MGVIDDYKFRLEAIKRKVARIEEVGNLVESNPLEKKNVSKLKVMSVDCDQLFEEFNEIIGKMVNYYNKQNPPMRVEVQALHAEVLTFENVYYNVHAFISEYIPDQESKLNKSMVTTAGPSTSGLASGPSLGISLPKLTITPFNGDIRTWPTFSELFIATVHENAQLSNVQKYMYLRSVLTGDPLSLIASLPITGGNYSVAWAALIKRYNDTNLLTNTYLDELLSTPAVLSDSHIAIRNLATSITEYTGALEALGHTVEDWAVLLLFLLRKKLSPKLRERWEKEATTPISVKDFIEFLNSQARILEAASSFYSETKSVVVKKGTSPNFRRSKVTSLAISTPSKQVFSSPKCINCGQKHYLNQCERFQSLNVHSRLRFVKARHLCLCCLSSGHFIQECPKKNPCRFCTAHHHSLLHIGDMTGGGQGSVGVAKIETPLKRELPRPDVDASGEPGSTLQVNTSALGSSVLLCTAQAMMLDQKGSYQPVKVLIDTASEGTFISKACLQRLGLQGNCNISVPVMGLAQTPVGVVKGIVSCTFQPTVRYPEQLTIEALVIDKIARCHSFVSQSPHWPHIENLTLADPAYLRPQAIDILLGAEWFSSIIVGSPIVGPPGTPSALESIWGYCLVGRVEQPSQTVQSFCSFTLESLNESIRKFWEVEEPPQQLNNLLSPVEKLAEGHFASTVCRQSSGRYVVQLPFDPSSPPLQDSRSSALRRFQLLERRLSSNPKLREKYDEFMLDYEQQGHMVPISSRSVPTEALYYIPHHCIFRDTVELSKFRVVFDASMRTRNGPSLNKCLLIGPKLQADIVDIVLRFRVHEVAMITDIRQMYRNIALGKEHYDYQRIFWRYNPDGPLKEYNLTTVTYGVSSAPFLAIRTLHQLVQDEGNNYPAASSAIMSNTYMDDVVVSVESVDKALRLQFELIALLDKAGFCLRKWGSNRVEVLHAVPGDHCAMSPDSFSFEDSSDLSTKVLGLVWNPKDDSFSYKVQSLESGVITKRSILSDLARLYDPMGYLSPVIFMGKCIIQYLWQLGLDWDTPPPDHVCVKWDTFRQELALLADLKLPRSLQLDSAVQIELHAFSDSSEKGYGAAVYVRGTQTNGIVNVSLLLAKSKVAPLKRVSLPRLELCAAVLAAKLANHVSNLLSSIRTVNSTTVWTDSSVTLGWVKASPHQWKTFVANRVTQAQEYLSPDRFRYVPTACNPADCASRGLLPSELLDHPLWLSGPKWLSEGEERWPPPLVLSNKTPTSEEARVMTLVTQLVPSFLEEVLVRFSSLSRLKRVTAYCLRFGYNARNIFPRTGFLSAEELSDALFVWVKLVQQSEFKEDLHSLKKHNRATARLCKLSPFLDNRGILRVGGRLHHATISFERKHPILLPKKHHLTSLVIDFYHKVHLHPGPLNLHSIISQSFWIIAGRDVIRRHVAKCTQCFKANPTPLQPIMGNLPRARLQEVKAFGICGLDYGGPFEISMGPLRTRKTYKGYICLFVCLNTRAVHLELTSDLSTDTFLAALRRFVSRRGAIREIYSDCGTNFVGASRKLTEWEQLVASSEYNDGAARLLGDRGIRWKFNPPSSPHFGGIWEAAIKSTKRLLHKVVGTQILTYEEFNTVLTQVESTLNSRPLVPLSSDPADLDVLTPAHFLLQEQPSALIEPDCTVGTVNYRQRWQLVQRVSQSFWYRWKNEYLCTLQQRAKWTKACANVQTGDMVILKDDNLPPLKWRLGRVIKVHPGRDGTVRVVDVKTAQGTLTRPVVKLCPLPMDEED